MYKKISAILLAVSIVGFISCNKEEEKVPLEESKANVENLEASIEEDMDMTLDNMGMTALMTYMECMNQDDPFFSISKKSTTPEIEKPSDLLTKGLLFPQSGEPTDISDYYGTYTWNAANEGWVIVQNDPDDKIVFVFPLDSTGSTTNNVTINVYSYTETVITVTDDYWGDEDYYRPTSLHADLLISGEKYVEIQGTATWDEEADIDDVNGTLFLKPYTVSLGLNQESTSAGVEVVLSEGSSRIMSAGLTISFATDEKDSVTTASGYIQYREVKLAGDIDVGQMDGIEGDPTADQMNEYISLSLYNYPQGSKFADIEFDYTDQQKLTAYIVYPDDTRVDAMPILENIISSVMNMLPEQGIAPR